jgi:thiosulfate dehydrogenase
MNHSILKLASAVFAISLIGALVVSAMARSESGPAKDVKVSLCDGVSTMTVPGLKTGEILTRERAQLVAEQMLLAWRATQGEERWARWMSDSHGAGAAALAPAVAAEGAPAAAPATGAQAGQPTKFTARDQMLWKREQEKWIAEGYKMYHSPTDLGGTTGVSCDMCHPDGSNTHPETYPKYQVQLKKVALLRDMINWCIQNPEKGKPLPEEDVRLRAVEAYILSTRKGVALEPGKH